MSTWDDSYSYDATGKGSSTLDPTPQQYGVAGMGFSILGGILKGIAQVQAGDFNAGIDRNNALVATYAAADARARGRFAAGQMLLRGDALASKQTAAYAGAGVAVSSGSAVDVGADTKGMSAFDALLEENRAAREAWGLETQASQFEEKAKLDQLRAKNQMGDSILGGITGAATAAQQFKLKFS